MHSKAGGQNDPMLVEDGQGCLVPPKNPISLDKYSMMTTSPVDGWMGGAGDLENKANSARWGLTELGNNNLIPFTQFE